jgi:5-carboxymethyl-2-hydroxymuconate isomerase
MPTLYFEYTNNLKISDKVKPFLLEIHHLLVDTIKTDLETCRSLVTPYSDFVIGSGNNNTAFIQLTINMLPGRSDEVKDKLGAAIYEKIKQDFSAQINQFKTQIRVYLQDTDIDHYYGLKQERDKA